MALSPQEPGWPAERSLVFVFLLDAEATHAMSEVPNANVDIMRHRRNAVGGATPSRHTVLIAPELRAARADPALIHILRDTLTGRVCARTPGVGKLPTVPKRVAPGSPAVRLTGNSPEHMGAQGSV